MAFYTDLFGWEAENTMPPDVTGKHYMCRLRGRDVAAVASRPEAAPAVTAWGTYVWVENAGETAAKAVDAGGDVVMQPFESLDGGRIAIIEDPAGRRWPSGNRAPTKEPSSVTSREPGR